LRRLERDYGKVELVKHAELGSLEETMRIFFSLHQKRWISKGKTGVFNDQDSRDNWLNKARLLAERDWLALYFLTADGKPIATQFCLEYNQRIHAVLSGFDPAYSSYSVGNLIILKILEKCIEKKVREYDFMRGDESYKFTWRAELRRNLDTRFVSNKLTSRLCDLAINTAKGTRLTKVLDKFLIL
jgi:CelD/BcsL family acetyltransferase involved in cellulose biosynthesis